MSFVFPALLFGAAAGLIPVVIHLLNRSRYRVVKWGAMHLLDAVVRVNRKRIRLEQLLLLLVRTALPVAVVFFMAKPVLTDKAVRAPVVKSSVVIALDDSYSMQAGGADASLFRVAVREVGKILDCLPRGSDAACVLMAGPPETPLSTPTVNLSELRRSLQKLPCAFGKADVPSALTRCAACFSDMSHADRELVVVSDFQKVSWSAAERVSLRAAIDTVRSSPFRPRITFLDIGSTLPVPGNVAVDSLTLSRFVIGVGQQVKVRARITNYGPEPHEALRVHFIVDGRRSETAQIPIGPGESTQAVFRTSFSSAGSHYVGVSVDADALTADNKLYAALPVWEAVEVLLVDGRPGKEPLSGATDYLRLALSPFGAIAATSLKDLIRPVVVPADRFSAELLRGKRVVVLAGVARLERAQVEALSEFVETGGGLLIFPGEKCDLNWYNRVLGPAGAGLLAGRIEAVRGSEDDPTKQTSISGEHFEHEALSIFNVPENGTIAGVEVLKWCPLVPPEGRAEAPFTVLARLAAGDPFLAEWKHGKGRVIYCTTTCDTKWTILPLRACYVPLFQQLVTYLASTVYPPRNVSVGDQLVAFLEKEAEGKTITVVLPDGSEREVRAVREGARVVAAFGETALPGLYTFRVSPRKPGGEAQLIHFVASASGSESRLERLSPQEVDSLASELGARVVRSAAQWRELRARDLHGRELSHYFFYLACALFVGEVLLLRFIGRRRKPA